MSAKRFWIQFAFFFFFAIAVPFFVINHYYDLFKERSPTAISGWGMIGILIGASVVLYALEMLLKALDAGVVKQTIMGFTRVIVPLTILLFITSVINNNIVQIQKMLYVFIPSFFVAIVVNPFPVWVANAEARRESKKMAKAMQMAKEMQEQPKASIKNNKQQSL